MNNLLVEKRGNAVLKKFPSPTGVNHYEFLENHIKAVKENGFRPQQGLTIMNSYMINYTLSWKRHSFRPQQGLTIMNENI